MGKVANRMSELSLMLEKTEKSKADIDNPPAEITKKPMGRPKKPGKKTWCGMMIPEPIYNICIYMKELLEEQGKYTKTMDIQIYNASVQQYIYNDLITKMIGQKEPIPVRALTTTSEAMRRALQSLGLTVTDKKQGITKEDAQVNPLAEMIEAMNTETEQKPLLSKKKK